MGTRQASSTWRRLASLSILVGLRLWGRYFANKKARLQVRGDSVVSLTLSRKLASSSKFLNGIGAEIALEIELLGMDEIFTEHTPGKLLVWADSLSRRSAPGGSDSDAIPKELLGAKRRTPPSRDNAFYKVWPYSV